jgi:MFS family permease
VTIDISAPAGHQTADETDSLYAWLRLAVSLTLGTIGSIGMWSFVVALPAVQADFAIARNEASLPYTLAMLGFGVGGILIGRLADRLGIVIPVLLGVLALALGYVCAGLAPNLWLLTAAHGLLGFGSSATFGPLMADISHWFTRRRGIAVTICSSGNYLAGVVWPPIVQHAIADYGWRATHVGIGVFCLASMVPLLLLLRRRAPAHQISAAGASVAGTPAALGLTSGTLQTALVIAGLGCCVAMSMPQVHIVAYCGDLGYGVARGAQMLSLMLGLGIIARLASGLIADRIGGLATLLIGSSLQGVALAMYLGFNGLTSLYIISGLFGLFQGGIVPMYAIIVREYFPPREAGMRLGIVLMATLLGMALGGWMAGAIFDFTGSYRAAFLNGIVWNLLNVSVMLWLLSRRLRRMVAA